MFCEQAQEEISRRSKGSFEPMEVPLFEEHLADCADCKALYQATILLERATASWQDEPVPPWRRTPLPSRRRVRPGAFFTWVPLAACLVMAILLASRVEITPGSFVLTFGESAPTTLAPAAPGLSRAEVVQLLANNRRESTAEIARVLDRFRLDSEANIKAVLARYSESEKQGRSRQFKVFAVRIQNQRFDDLDLIQAHFRRFLDRQNKNASNLENLASYVQRTPTR